MYLSQNRIKNHFLSSSFTRNGWKKMRAEIFLKADEEKKRGKDKKNVILSVYIFMCVKYWLNKCTKRTL